MGDIKGIFCNIRERISKAYLATITSTKIKWFSMLDQQRARALNSALVQHRFQKGEIIFDIGESSDNFFFLHEGRIRLDSMVEVEHITKWPLNKKETEWNVHSKKVIRSLKECEAPDLIGHIPALQGSKTRHLRAVAITDVTVLQGKTNLLIEYLTHDQLKAMRKSVSDKNPYDIGKVFLSNRYDMN